MVDYSQLTSEKSVCATLPTLIVLRITVGDHRSPWRAQQRTFYSRSPIIIGALARSERPRAKERLVLTSCRL
jgi:hypothetical protein